MAETRPTDAPDAGPYEDDLVDPATPPPAGNRPAVGAREVEGAAAVPANWQGGQGATDFLGLDPTVPAAPEIPADGTASAGAAQPTDSWLFDIERAGEIQNATPIAAPVQATAAAPATTEPEAELPAESLDELLEAPQDEAMAELVPAGPRPTPRPSGARRALLSIVLLAALGAAGWYGWQRFGRVALDEARIASLPPPAPKPAPARPQPAPTPAPPVADATPPAPQPPPEPVAVVPDVVPEPVQIPDEPAPEPEPPVAIATEPPALPRAPQDTRRAPADPEPLPGGARRATEEDLKGLWLGNEIPRDAIALPERLRTLNVGRVRLHLQHGEHVEGTLHAVGEGRIWLEFPLGRMSFAASDVRELTQIAGASTPAGKPGSQALAGLPSVEVVFRGGVLRGRLLSREGDRVKLHTQEGLRVEVDALDIRPVPAGATRLIGPVAKVGP